MKICRHVYTCLHFCLYPLSFYIQVSFLRRGVRPQTNFVWCVQTWQRELLLNLTKKHFRFDGLLVQVRKYRKLNCCYYSVTQCDCSQPIVWPPGCMPVGTVQWLNSLWKFGSSWTTSTSLSLKCEWVTGWQRSVCTSRPPAVFSRPSDFTRIHHFLNLTNLNARCL